MAAKPTASLRLQPPLILARLIAVSAPFGVVPATPDDLPQAQTLASRLMGHKVASLGTYLRVQSVQPAAVLVSKAQGQVTGVMGILFLRQEAVDQLLDGVFDALDPDINLLTVEGETPVAAYAWGVAVADKTAGQAVLGAGNAVKQQLFPTITSFTRTVTGAGRHVALTRYGYRPLRHSDDDLMVSEPRLVSVQAA